METDVLLPLAPGLEGVEYAITIAQPWCSITVEGPRRLHNLATRPPVAILGRKVAIFAAAKPDTTTGGQAMELLDACGIGKSERAAWKTRKTFDAVIGTALVVGVVADHGDPWFVGPYALLLAERRALARPVSVEPAHIQPGGIWRLS